MAAQAADALLGGLDVEVGGLMAHLLAECQAGGAGACAATDLVIAPPLDGGAVLVRGDEGEGVEAVEFGEGVG